MEKFALLNLFKAIDGLKNGQPSQNASSPPPSFAASEPAQNSPSGGTSASPSSLSSALSPASPSAADASGYNPGEKQMPNIMYETLVRHEQISYRIKNKR